MKLQICDVHIVQQQYIKNITKVFTVFALFTVFWKHSKTLTP